MIQTGRRLWEKWKITILFIGVVSGAWFTHVVDIRHADDACTAVTQVHTAVVHLTKPVSEAGITDPATAARIAASNQQKAQAKAVLDKDLACR